MEEKEGKVVEMGKREPQKLSYEQLENVAHQLSDQNKQLYQALQKANVDNLFKRLEYLFKVLEQDHHFPDEFITKCAEEIVSMITIPEKEEETEETE